MSSRCIIGNGNVFRGAVRLGDVITTTPSVSVVALGGSIKFGGQDLGSNAKLRVVATKADGTEVDLGEPADLTVTVTGATTVSVSTMSGNVTVRSPESVVNANTMSGSVSVRDGHVASAKTMTGSISCSCDERRRKKAKTTHS